MKDNLRKCVGCQILKNRVDMFRIMQKYDTKEIVFSPDSKTFGRSFYVCKNKECIDLAFKKSKNIRLLDKDKQQELKEMLQKNLIN